MLVHANARVGASALTSALVTGGTAGIGHVVVATLAANGWRVASLARRQPSSSNSLIQYFHADFGDLSSVRSFADSFSQKIDLLVMNAGIGTFSPGGGRLCLSKDGNELRFQVNYLSHYLLVRELARRELLTPRFACVAVTTAICRAPELGDVNLFANYDPAIAYARSKGALAMLSLDLFDGQHAVRPRRSTVCDPGSYVPTGMDRPGRPRITPFADAVRSVINSIHQAVRGGISEREFAALPTDVRSVDARRSLQLVSNALLGD
jgi:NAD(P)-dependent dehydrogenase (short-subunit alcohol dehydrogenase family)